MPIYQFADLSLESDFEIPELKVAERLSCNLKIKEVESRFDLADLLSYHSSKQLDGEIWYNLYKFENKFYVEYPKAIIFELNVATNLISFFLETSINNADFRHLLLDQVLPLYMSQLDKLIFHGSAVAFENQAYIFLAPSGVGKSTIAKLLTLAGGHFLSDDCVPITFGEEINVLPSYNVVRLWDEGLSTRQFKKLEDLKGSEKKRYSLAAERENDANTSFLLARIIILQRDSSVTRDSFTITKIEDINAIGELLKNIIVLETNEKSRQMLIFEQLNLILKSCSVHELRFSDLTECVENLKLSLLNL